MKSDYAGEFLVTAGVVVSVVIGAYFISKKAEKIFYEKGFEQGYIEACKDFYKGQVKYTLVENPDGTVVWSKIDNADHRKQRGRTAPNMEKK